MTTTLARLWCLPPDGAWAMQSVLCALYDLHPSTSLQGVANFLNSLPATEREHAFRCFEVFGGSWDVEAIRAALPSLTEA